MEHPSTPTGVKSTDIYSFPQESEKCTVEEKTRVASKILTSQYKLLARLLGVTEGEIDHIETMCRQNNLGPEEITYQILVKWEEKKGDWATKEVLVAALQAIARTDVVHEAFSRSCQESQFSMNDFQREMQQRQKRYFRNMKLPRSLWLKRKKLLLEELFMELTMKTKNETGEEENEVIDKEEIFDPTENEIPLRILIEGHPGYGKTTLILKLASDWSREAKYISEKYDLLFVIPLRNYKSNLSVHLLRQCDGIQGNDEEKLRAIEAMEGKVLLLLDGIDEVSETVQKSLLSLLSKDLYPRMTVIVTCRTGHLHLGTIPDEDSKILEIDGFENESFWDKRIQIKGVSPERRSEFLGKYLNTELTELENIFSDSSFTLTDFFQCPLFLLLLAVIIQDEAFHSIKTKTQLYKTIFNFVINRSLEKLLGETKEFDIFTLNDPDQFCFRHLLSNFGRICLEKIKLRSLTFEKRELSKLLDGGENDLIIKLGFLSKQISFFNYEEKEHYEPIHKSFLEFLAAFYLSSLGDNELEREIQLLLLKFNIGPKQNVLLYTFLGGFLQENAFKLFNAFSPFKSMISIFDNFYQNYNVEDILEEIPQTDDILKALENLSAGNWGKIKYKESLVDWYKGLVNYYVKNKISEEITLNIPEQLNIINVLSENLKINNIKLNVERLKPTEEEMKLKNQSCECENLLIDLKHGISNEFLLLLKEIMLTFRAEKVWLKIDYRLEKSLNEAEKQKLFKQEGGKFMAFTEQIIQDQNQNINIHYLTLDNISPYLFQLISPQIEDLVRGEKLKYGINIQFSKGKMNDTIMKSWNSCRDTIFGSHLESIGLDNYLSDELFPLPLCFLDIQLKDKKFLGLRGEFAGICVINSFSVEHFSYIPLKPNIDGLLSQLLLKSKNVKSLTCKDWFISDLSKCDSMSAWEGFQTVQRLDIGIIEWGIHNDHSFLTGIALFKNVKEIHLYSFKQAEFLIKVTLLLPSLKKISINNCVFPYVSTEALLLNFLQTSLALKDEKVNLEEVEVQGLSEKNYSSMDFIYSLKKCFQNNIFRTFSISNESIRIVHDFLIHFLSKKEFEVSSEWRTKSRYRQMFLSYVDEIPQLNHKLSISILSTNT